MSVFDSMPAKAGAGLTVDRAFVKGALLLALPVALQTLLQAFLGMADVMMVGALGDVAIAAVGLAAKIHFLLLVAMSGLATACSVMVAQYFGARRLDDCKNTLAMTVAIGLLTMFPLALFFALTSSLWVPFITPDARVSDLAGVYLQITAPILVVTQVSVIYEASLRALGNTTLPLLASSVSVFVNIVANYALIYGHWGLPELGVAGAAWATLIARIVQLVLILTWVYGRKHAFAMNIAELRRACRFSKMKPFLFFSLPLIGNYVFWGIGNTIYHVLTGFAGTDALAVFGIIVPIEMCFLSVFLGIANAAAVLIGQTLGADRKEEAWGLFRLADRVTVILAVVLCTALWFGKGALASVYSDLSPHALELLLSTLTVFCLGIWLKMLNLVRIIGVLRAGGDHNFCLAADMSVMWGIGLPLYVAAIWYGEFSFVVLYMLTFVEDAAKCIPVRLRINKRRWVANLTR